MIWDSVWAGSHADWAVADPSVELLNKGGLQATQRIETAIIICLFTDRRRMSSMITDDESDEPRGWHGDTYDVVAADGEQPLGSFLWTLERGSLTEENLRLAEGYAREALQTLVHQGVVKKFDIKAERVQLQNRLNLSIRAYNPQGEQTFDRTFQLE